MRRIDCEWTAIFENAGISFILSNIEERHSSLTVWSSNKRMREIYANQRILSHSSASAWRIRICVVTVLQHTHCLLFIAWTHFHSLFLIKLKDTYIIYIATYRAMDVCVQFRWKCTLWYLWAYGTNATLAYKYCRKLEADNYY